MIDDTQPDVHELPGFQRKWLRGRAHSLKPVVIVGDSGVTPGVAKAVSAALLEHELIKVKLRQPEDKKAMAEELAGRTQAALCGLVGHVVILYKEHPEEPTLKLPQREAAKDEPDA
jgi:RNA-binding protein